MTRPHILPSLLVCIALLSGCGNKKDPNDPATAHKSKDQQKLESAQRQAKQNPDKFESSTDDPPLSADTRFAAGQLAESQGDLNRAIVQFREALKIDPNHKNSLFHMGACYTQLQRYNDAIVIWQRYLKVTNYSPAAYNNLALCYEQAGKLDDAEKTYRAGIEKEPSDGTCRVNYGLMLARHGRIDDATAQLQTVCTPAEVQYNLGSVFLQQGNKEEARKRFQKALELDPKLVDARSQLAKLK